MSSALRLVTWNLEGAGRGWGCLGLLLLLTQRLLFLLSLFLLPLLCFLLLEPDRPSAPVSVTASSLGVLGALFPHQGPECCSS